MSAIADETKKASDDTAQGPESLGTLLASLGNGVSTASLAARLSFIVAEGRLDLPTVEAVCQLNTRLGEASRRESLLRVLYDTATDLTGIRDVEAVLAAIVRRTRALIGSDIAYLSLNDYETNESYIRVTDGATTALFRNIRIPLGEGVLGAVATGSSPAQSPDYLSDTSKSHLESSDTAVDAEGVKAIMGVPLRVEGQVIGALMVADRHPHVFSRDDIALMESIGTHAAVALENARHFSEMADTLARLDRAQSENLEHVQALEKLSALDKSMVETLASADSLPNLLRVLTESLGHDVFVLSATGEPMTGLAPQGDFGSSAALGAAEASAMAKLPVPFNLDDGQFVVMAAIAGDQHLASLIVAGDLAPAGLAVLERSSLVLSAALLFERTFQDAQYRLQLELVDDLMNPRAVDIEVLKRRAGRFGLTNDTQLVVRIVSVGDDQRQRALAVLKRQTEGRPGITALHESHLCIIEPASRRGTRNADDASMGPMDGGEKIVDGLKRRRIVANVGSSDAVVGFAKLSAAHAEASAVVQALQALMRNGEAADRVTLGTTGMLLGAMDSPFATELLAAQLGPLLAYDERRSTQLALTAWTFLENDSSTASAAASLHVHVNTLRQRLERIDNVIGATWRRGSRSLDIHVALRLWRLKSAGTGVLRH
ncbi:helix-turn-helix domain-containing protein [Cryobacterium ruanii]|uniref:GAF domain-containing protein n=1 Tax=Cryobacterium ruanii TaxID=1259197 RepID=A0A4R9ANS9_9MICO|nr:GAF domain-containing protein [Cryobacterium ruanii]TFD66722.1 GAF domain-containing protein [Cryobacterium ruanii]